MGYFEKVLSHLPFTSARNNGQIWVAHPGREKYEDATPSSTPAPQMSLDMAISSSFGRSEIFQPEFEFVYQMCKLPTGATRMSFPRVL